jgi:hypothetical protein
MATLEISPVPGNELPQPLESPASVGSTVTRLFAEPDELKDLDCEMAISSGGKNSVRLLRFTGPSAFRLPGYMCF